ncbi:glycerol-3-phosphate dehydrogenase/oxidase [Peribacillus alkalitolerans]|uniref:glycerol-3-phosphate dehydrogenase/oxidase n=1 Tax=Peribacillus alkalitolerans TaxID=1550385 RepID=UPI0013D53C68|nr:FAD-dependent oxidoreductase [Peribacillus alkalitolerans]
MAFSNLNRKQDLLSMQQKEYDLFIIGGGITGTGIALDAVTRGMKVGLADMQDFAAGTSSRSTKLVHGGLRYLKQFQVAMVAEVGKERTIVYENGPHVTTPEWMLLPFHIGGTFGRLSTSLGLQAYDFLAGVKRNERRTMLSREEVLQKEPLVKKEGLVGGGYYVEYRTDDSRLTIEVAKKAVEFGADLVNYLKVTGFIYENDKVAGVYLEDTLSGETFKIKAKKVINATGPWVDFLREMDHSKYGKSLKLTKGVHLVIDQSKFPLKQSVYFDTPDGRMVFAIPRNGKTYVGTTDTFYNEDPKYPTMTNNDRTYILECIHYMFPNVTITERDVESSWAGVRPLILEDGKNPSEISRKDEIWVSDSGLITIAGGKLTGYRKMAETVVNQVVDDLKREEYKLFGSCQTKKLPISGGEVGGAKNLQNYIKKQAKLGMEVGLSSKESKEMAHTYGSNVGRVFELINNQRHVAEKYGLPLEVFGKLEYSILEERIGTPIDFFLRRTGTLLFDIIWVLTWKDKVVEYMADVFGWNTEQKQHYQEDLEREIQNAQIPIDLQIDN